jgi:hypothetical protein
VQTLAWLGHLVRHQNLRFRGPDDLVAFVTEMRQRVRPERRLDTDSGIIELYSVSRDASTYEAFPELTWMLAFGWYMHPVFKLRHDFPMHPNLRPIFVSFHCNKHEMLTAAAIDYLCRYGPVGCRDWTTVDLLLSMEIPAFFSGCLTTTIDTLFPDLDPTLGPRKPETVYVDARGDILEGAATASQDSAEVRQRGFVANLREAVALLERYRRTYSRVVTSKLHCYLPVRSLGLEVDFRPKNRADARFNGLIDIDDAEFDAIRSGLLDRLAPVLAAIVGGKSEAEVYQLWRELCTDDVAVARARREAVGPVPPLPFDLAETGSRIAAAATTEPATTHPADEVVDVAIVANADDRHRLPVVVDSMLANTAQQLHLWLLSRGYERSDWRHLAESFPDLWISWLPFDTVTFGGPEGGAGTSAGLDLLLLPDLLGDIARVVVLPPGAVVVVTSQNWPGTSSAAMHWRRARPWEQDSPAASASSTVRPDDSTRTPIWRTTSIGECTDVTCSTSTRSIPRYSCLISTPCVRTGSARSSSRMPISSASRPARF